DVLAAVYPQARDMAFMTVRRDADVIITRSGYTGEDGFEISLPAAAAPAFAQQLRTDGRAGLAALGARGSLRLEAGLCLYGHDIDAQTTPVEAGLKWVISKTRRAARDFPGADRILAQIASGPARLRVGLRPQDKAPLREGVEVFTAGGEKAGIITSGGFGPSAGAPVAMGYVDARHAA